MTNLLERPLARRGRLAMLALAALLALSLGLANACTTVPPGHNKVGTLLGKVQPEPYAEGFHLVNPLLRFTAFDLRSQTHTWQQVQVPSQDKLKTSMDVSVTLRIDPARTPEILQETGHVQDVIDKHVTPKVRSLLREAGKSVPMSQDFFQEEVQQALQTYMEAGLQGFLKPKGVIVEAVLFRDITLPEVVHNAVVQTKERQEQLEREKAQLRIVEQQAQQVVKKAQAQEQAAIAEANAKRTASEAEAYRILKEAEAQAEANALLARSLSAELIHYKRVEQWNGVYPTTLLSGEAGGMILELPGPATR